MSFSDLKDLVPKAASKYHLQGELQAALVINRASSLIKEIFPEVIYRKIRVRKCKEKVLWVAVSNSAIAQELHMKSFQLKKDLNDSLGAELVTKIRSFQESSLR